MLENAGTNVGTGRVESETFVLTSKPHLYVIRTTKEPYEEAVDGLMIRELFEPVHDDTLPDGIGNYSIVIEGVVTSESEIWTMSEKAHQLAEDLNRTWTYVCGHPINVARLGLTVRTAPPGWMTDVPEIRERISAKRSGLTCGSIEIKTRYWVFCSDFPLRRALRVRESLLDASVIVRTLISLHHMALTSRESEVRLLLLAKALEIVRAILPGRRDQEKQRKLPYEIISELRRGSLDWLSEIANSRLDVRHAIRNKNGPKLHRRISKEERKDFEHDANLVICSVVCGELGQALVILRDAPPKNGT